MKKLLAASIMILTIMSGCAAAQPTSNPAVVQLRTPDGLSYCSGFVINKVKQYVATAEHCMVQPFAPTIDGGPVFEFYHDPERDIAVLFVPDLNPNRPELKPATRLLVEEEPIQFQGYVKEAFIAISGKVVVQEATFSDGADKKWGPITIFYPEVIGGMSGGPILDKEGKVVGMVQAGRDAPPLSVSTPVRVILESFKKYWPTE